MNVKSLVSYLAVFLAGALGLFGLLALSGNLSSNSVVALENSSGSASGNSQTAASVQSTDAIAAGMTKVADLTRNTVVTLQGTVERITDEDEFLLADDTGTVAVWTGQRFFTVDQGEEVTVTGFVDDDLFLEVYAQEIVRADGSVVEIGWRSSEQSLNENGDEDPQPAAAATGSRVDSRPAANAAEQTAIGQLVRNSSVTVVGQVERVTDEDEFVIADGTGSVTVWTGQSFFTVDQGEQVTVRGFIDNDLILEIYATEIIRADGTVITIGSTLD